MSENGREAAFPGCGQVFTTDAQGRTLPQSAWGLEGAEGLSKRELAAMMLKVPTSGTDWLDEMIREANRNELAAKAMEGMMSRTGDTHECYAIDAHEIADAMLAERGRK